MFNSLLRMALVISVTSGMTWLSSMSQAGAQNKQLPQKRAAETKVAEKPSSSGGGVVVVPESDGIVPAKADEGEGPIFKFSTEGAPSASGEVREPLLFKVPTGTADTSVATPGAPPIVKSEISDDEPFRAYLGYPKHQAGAYVAPQSLSAKWTFSGQDFNFETTTFGYGVNYRFLATPLFSISADWLFFTAGVAEESIGTSFIINDSNASYDSLNVNADYCFVSSLTFYQQFCTGLVIGKDSYPILEFTGDTAHLQMGKVEDIILGLKTGYQVPATPSILVKMALGYNMGTGVGNSGALTSDNNTSLYANIYGWWNFRMNQDLGLGFDYVNRTATLKGRVGSNDFEWETTSAIIGAKLLYAYTF